MNNRTWLGESTVEEIAVNHLATYYRGMYAGPIFTARQFSLKGRTGIADGFIAIRDSEDAIHTASIEAKSIKTFKEILPSPDPSVIKTAALTVGFLFGGFAGVFVFFISNWIWAFIAGVITLSCLYGVLRWVFKDYAFFQQMGMIDDRLRKYKANERWFGTCQ